LTWSSPVALLLEATEYHSRLFPGPLCQCLLVSPAIPPIMVCIRPAGFSYHSELPASLISVTPSLFFLYIRRLGLLRQRFFLSATTAGTLSSDSFPENMSPINNTLFAVMRHGWFSPQQRTLELPTSSFFFLPCPFRYQRFLIPIPLILPSLQKTNTSFFPWKSFS